MAVKRTIKRAADADVMAIGEAFEEFYAEKEGTGKSASTLRNYKQSFEYFLAFHSLELSDTLDKVSAPMFYEWANTLKLDGVKPTSINHYLRDCRAFFYWCMDELREYMPAFKIHEVEAQEETIKLFTDEELELLLDKPRRQDSFATWRTYYIVNWVLGTGNRAGTIVDVKVGDIDFKSKDIKLGHTKNKKAQTIPLSSSLETALKEYIRTWRKDAPADAWLFCNVGEEQLTTNALRLSFTKYCKDRGVSRTNIHGLRHNFAKAWIRNNGDIARLQRILGHATLDMTRRYIKLFSEDLKEDFDRFNPLDNIKRKQKRTLTVKRTDD